LYPRAHPGFYFGGVEQNKTLRNALNLFISILLHFGKKLGEEGILNLCRPGYSLDWTTLNQDLKIVQKIVKFYRV